MNKRDLIKSKREYLTSELNTLKRAISNTRKIKIHITANHVIRTAFKNFKRLQFKKELEAKKVKIATLFVAKMKVYVKRSGST